MLINRFFLQLGCCRMKCLRSMSVSIAKIAYPQIEKIGTEHDRQQYNSVLPIIIDDITERFKDFPLFAKQLSEAVTYTLADQVHYSGCAVPVLFKTLKNGSDFTSEDLKVANIVGRCTDLVFGACQITDDLMDASLTKLGKPCLYKKENIGINAINDAVLVKQCMYFLLKKHLQDHPNYFPITELTRLIWTYLTYGQTMDMTTSCAEFSLELYTAERFSKMMLYKSSYPVFYLPIVNSLYLSNKYNEKLLHQVKEFSNSFGLYYAALNDMIDCYADPSKIGSLGTDIQEGKCSWLIVKALEVATDNQKKILAENYRKPNEESYWQVRKVYDEVDIPNRFLKYEKECFLNISKQIEKSDDIFRESFTKILNIFESNSIDSS